MNTLKENIGKIFSEYSDKRICVLGTTCSGKSTMQQNFPESIDMDEAFFPTLSENEKSYICSKPWTSDIGKFTNRLVHERVTIKVGHPLFSLILLDCDIIVYLDISDSVLKEHCQKRGTSFEDAKRVKKAIERTISNSKELLNVIYFEFMMDE